MALARTNAMALAGVQGHVVEIEADIENGLVALFLVGLPDTALREARRPSLCRRWRCRQRVCPALWQSEPCP